MHDTITYSHLDIIRSARDAAQRLGLAPENNFDTLESYWRDPAPFDAADALSDTTPDSAVSGSAEVGEWRSVEQEALRKGLRRSPKYYPTIGEWCRMSGPNCDDADGFTWADVEVLWCDDLFVVTRVPGCWPTVTKLELALFEPARKALTEGQQS